MTASLEEHDDLAGLYSTGELARILALPPARVRSWTRLGLLAPTRVEGRLAFFDFGQMAGARAISRLVASGVRPARLRRSLEALDPWWPEAARSLAGVEAIADGPGLLVRTPTGALAEPNGQLVLDFEHAADAPGEDAAETAAPVALWFHRGLKLEEAGRDEEAILAYTKALGLGHPPPELAFNLGNLLFRKERREEASQCFALATEIDPEYAEAWNNLGNAQAACNQREEAVRSYERALALDERYADAHFNLGETLAELGRTALAREHWQSYLALDPASPWANEVRARMRRTE
jgi:tetratricopeptide (TPR) repeat protein